jgi:hypothetical protein
LAPRDDGADVPPRIEVDAILATAIRDNDEELCRQRRGLKRDYA